MTIPYHLKPNIDLIQDYKDAYLKWFSTDEVVRCYTLVMVTDMFQQRHRNIETFADMIYNLDMIKASSSSTNKIIKRIVNKEQKVWTRTNPLKASEGKGNPMWWISSSVTTREP